MKGVINIKLLAFFIGALLLNNCKKTESDQQNDQYRSLSADTVDLSWGAVKKRDSISRLKQQRLGDSINTMALRKALADSVNTKKVLLIQFYRDTIPKDLFKLTRLTTLTINFTYIQILPIELCKLKEIEVLNLSHNKLTNIDNVICLNKLAELDLLANKLTSVPQDFSQLETLHYLTLSNNDFSKGLQGTLPRNVREINLGYAKLKVFPKELLKLRFVNKINLADNPGIKSIPIDIRGLQYLEELNLMNTGIRKEEIDKLRKLMPSCKIQYSYLKEKHRVE